MKGQLIAGPEHGSRAGGEHSGCGIPIRPLGITADFDRIDRVLRIRHLLAHVLQNRLGDGSGGPALIQLVEGEHARTERAMRFRQGMD